MLPLPKVFSPDVFAARALNALLRREPWAAERLSRHAGKAVRFNVGQLRVGLTIDATGHMQASDAAVIPDVSLTLATEHLVDLPAILRTRDVSAITEKLHVQGDAALATLVAELARDLRWDIDQEAAGLFGDVAGPQLIEGARAAADVAQTAAQRFAGNVAEYLGEEGGMLLTQPAFDAFRHDCQAMLGRLNALEARLGRQPRPESQRGDRTDNRLAAPRTGVASSGIVSGKGA